MVSIRNEARSYMDSWVCIHQDFENKKGQTVRISLMYDYFADVCINCYCILITASYAWYVIYITYLISSLYNILSISVTCKDGSRCVIKWSILYNLKELGCGMLWNLEKKINIDFNIHWRRNLMVGGVSIICNDKIVTRRRKRSTLKWWIIFGKTLSVELTSGVH